MVPAIEVAIAKRKTFLARKKERQRREHEKSRLQLKFLRVLYELREASSDDVCDDLTVAGAANSGTAIQCLVEEGLVYRDGDTPSKRKGRNGHSIGIWRAACNKAVAEKIAELERLISSADLSIDDDETEQGGQRHERQ